MAKPPLLFADCASLVFRCITQRDTQKLICANGSLYKTGFSPVMTFSVGLGERGHHFTWECPQSLPPKPTWTCWPPWAAATECGSSTNSWSGAGRARAWLPTWRKDRDEAHMGNYFDMVLFCAGSNPVMSQCHDDPQATPELLHISWNN